MAKKNKLDDLIQQNNDLRKQLTEENEQYYTDLLVYIRTAGLFYDDEQIELQLLEILHDLLEAQASGTNAYDYFGADPQVIADQLISNFPRAGIKEKMKIFGMIFGISSFFAFITQLGPNSNQLNLLPFVLNGLLTLIGVQGFFWLMHSDIYSHGVENRRKTNLVVGAFSVVLFALLIGAQFLKPEALFFTVPDFLLFGASLTLPIIFTGLTFFGKEKWRSLMLAMLPFIWIMSGVYLLQRFNFIDFRSDTLEKYGITITLFFSFFWYQFIFYMESKKEQ